MTYPEIDASKFASRYFILDCYGRGRFTDVLIEVTIPDFDFAEYAKSKQHRGAMKVISPTQVAYADGSTIFLIETSPSGHGATYCVKDTNDNGLQVATWYDFHRESRLDFYQQHGFKLKGFAGFNLLTLPDESR